LFDLFHVLKSDDFQFGGEHKNQFFLVLSKLDTVSGRGESSGENKGIKI